MTDPQPAEPKRAAGVSPRGRPRGLKRTAWILVPVIGVVLAGWMVHRHYTNPNRIRAVAEAYLQSALGGLTGRVAVGSARFSLFDGLRLLDVTVQSRKRASRGLWVAPRSAAQGAGKARSPLGSTDAAAPVFSCREVKLNHDLASVIFGPLRVQSIIALEPTCSIVWDALDGSNNLAGLLRLPDGTGDSASASPPIIELRDARMRVVRREEDRARVVEELTLTLRARPSQHDPHVYDMVWQSGGPREAQQASGHSRIDLRTGRLRNIRGGLPWMSIEAVMLALGAGYDGAGFWCDLLGLDDTVRARDYNFNEAAGFGPRGAPDAHHAPPARAGSSATIELSNASISIPITEKERTLPPEERYLRFARVEGRAQLMADGIRMEFTGLFHGSECKVSGTVRGGAGRVGTLDDLDFDVRLSVKGLELPRPDPGRPLAEVRFVNRWRRLARFYKDYDPHGHVDIELDAVKQAGRDERIVVDRAVLSARGGDASCRHFPYRLRKLEGTVEYGPDGVFIRGLRGQHQGGVVSVEGRLTRPSEPRALARADAPELRITARSVPIDEALGNALPEPYRRIREQFRPGGTVDVDIILTQPAGTEGAKGKWRSESTITLRDVSAGYIGLPYPIHHLTGTLIVDRDGLQAIDITGHSGDAAVTVDGAVTFAGGAVSGLDLAVRAQDVPFDAPLLSALPAEMRKQVGAFHPSGRFDVRTSLALDPETNRVVHMPHVTLRDVAIRHDSLPVELTAIQGQLRITPDVILVDGLTGRYNNAVVSARGSIARTGAGRTAELVVRTGDLLLDDTLYSALPRKVSAVLADWKVDGPITTETTISTDPGRLRQTTEAALVRTVVRLSGASVRHPFFSIPFRDVRGEITIDGAGVKATDVEARYGPASVHVDFDTRHTGGGEEGIITLSAIGVTLDDSLRALLPDGMAAAWDRLAPAGSIDLHLDNIRYRRSGPERPREWSATGYVELNEVALRGAAGVERMSGTLVGSGAVVDRHGGTSLNGKLTLSSLDLAGGRVSHAESAWSYTRAARPGRSEGLLTLDSIRGRIGDGSLTGKIEITFDADRTDFSLSANVHNIEIEPFLHGDRASRSADSEPADGRGEADGRLYLAGVLGDPSSRRGGGRFEVRGGRLYRLPIMLAILNALNMSTPDEEDAFNAARADFFIVGNRLQLEGIILGGSGPALVGSGSVSLPDRGVCLDLVNVSPRRWAHVPVLADFVEGASRELVELHVTGSVSRPTVEAKPFRRVREELKRLFQRRQPKKIRASAS